jgi:hypothetical protein
VSLLRRRPILRFFLLLAGVYVLLIVPWPGVNPAYMAFFRLAGNLLFHSTGPVGVVHFENRSPPNNPWATRVTFKNLRTGAEAHNDRCYARHSYLTYALLTALIVATPVPWSRRWKSLLLGLLLASAAVAFTIWLGIMDIFSGPPPVGQFSLSAFWRAALAAALRILTLSPEVPFALPTLIWPLVTLRPDDARRWLGHAKP